MDAADSDVDKGSEQLAPSNAQPIINAGWPSSGNLTITSRKASATSVVNISGGSTVSWVAIQVRVASSVLKFVLGTHTLLV